ncbi:MAG TPA: adenylate kinase [Fervidicoccus fontis]|uniref:Adenylate kinase n=1 Tax=Fervidicoccus fontis TaxID=683846 RepID=A0A7C2UQV6_9CREN|nr:MAG: adenylate kinase [Fervidicoccus sp.]HEU98087.1 adenylate kinase [Fervidicoccus fontis]
MEMKTVIITGVPGVGKTTVIGELSNLLKERGISYFIANFGDFMLKSAISEGLVTSRDQIRKLSHRLQVKLQGIAAREIANEARKQLANGGILIVDTHAIVKTSTGYWPGLPSHVVEELNPDVIAVLEASAEEIYRRQSEDRTRDRKDIQERGIEEIRELMLYARVAAISSAVVSGASVLQVLNERGKAREAAETILRVIDVI